MMINNERGAALIIAVLASIIVILVLNQALSTKLGSVNEEMQKQLRISAGIQVMHDFALIAQKANETWEANGGASCPVSPDVVADAAGREFCWPTAAAPVDLRCVNHPLSDPANPVSLCLTGATPALVVADNKELLDFQNQYDWLEALLPKLGFMEAHAQEVIEGHRPGLGGAPTNNQTPNMDCDAGSAGDTYCKRCDPAAAKNMECVLLKVCLLPNGCAENQYVRQVVGIMPH